MRLTSVSVRAVAVGLLVLSASVNARADSGEREARDRYRAANKAFEDGEDARAVDELNRSIAAKPTAKSYLLMGNAKLKLDQLDEARRAFEKVIELDPKSSRRATVEGYVRDLDLLAR